MIRATAAEEVRVFALTGAGQRVFCAGADLDEAGGETKGAASARAYDAQWDDLSADISNLPCVTLAAVNGACIGGGMSVAMAFDLRIAASHAYFSYPAALHGFMPSPKDVQRLIQIGGRPAASRILIGGMKLPAAEAVSCGLIDRTMASGDVWAELVSLEERLGASKHASILAAKRLIQATGPSSQLEDLCYRAVYDSDQAAIKALRSSP